MLMNGTEQKKQLEGWSTTPSQCCNCRVPCLLRLVRISLDSVNFGADWQRVYWSKAAKLLCSTLPYWAHCGTAGALFQHWWQPGTIRREGLQFSLLQRPRRSFPWSQDVFVSVERISKDPSTCGWYPEQSRPIWQQLQRYVRKISIAINAPSMSLITLWAIPVLSSRPYAHVEYACISDNVIAHWQHTYESACCSVAEWELCMDSEVTHDSDLKLDVAGQRWSSLKVVTDLDSSTIITPLDMTWFGWGSRPFKQRTSGDDFRDLNRLRRLTLYVRVKMLQNYEALPWMSHHSECELEMKSTKLAYL